MLAIWPPTSFSITLDESKVIDVGAWFGIGLSDTSSRTLRLNSWSTYKPSGSVALKKKWRTCPCS